MSVPVHNVNELIVNALYLTGELGVGENPDAFMLSQGLELLNETISAFSADSIYIPYLNTLSFNMVVNQRDYTVGNLPECDIYSDPLVDIVYGNYTVNNVVYPLDIILKPAFYNITYLNNFQTRPTYVFLNKQPQVSVLSFYPAPDQPYFVEMRVKSMLDALDEQESLQGLPPYFYGLLKYGLARAFRTVYPSANWPQTAEEQYQRYFRSAKQANEFDIVVRPSTVLVKPQPYFWQNIKAYN